MSADIVALTDEQKDDPGLKGLLAGYYARLAEMNLKKGNEDLCRSKAKSDPMYVGTEKCVECHEEAYAFWKKTKHAKAWATLEDQNKHFDLTCVGCHTVGYEKPGGFCRLADAGTYHDVGCENCHGAGSIHIDDEEPSSIVLGVTEATCAAECHVPEHSDAFVFEKYLKEITGPGHELSGG